VAATVPRLPTPPRAVFIPGSRLDCPHGAASARAHDHEIVLSGFDLVQERGPHRLRAGGEHDGIGTQLAIVEGHDAALGIDGARPPPEAQLHLVLIEPPLRFDREFRGVHLAAQEGLGQGRTLVGQARLGADERHGAAAAGVPVRARRGKAGWAGPHDDEPLSRHHAGPGRSCRGWP